MAESEIPVSKLKSLIEGAQDKGDLLCIALLVALGVGAEYLELPFDFTELMVAGGVLGSWAGQQKERLRSKAGK